MDVTILRNRLKEQGYRFFPAYLYLTTKAIGKQHELRMGMKDGVLGYWENLTPTYPQFHNDDKTASLLWTEYDDCFQTFYGHYLEDGVPLANAYTISCIPWFTFNSFSLHNHGLKGYYVPSLEAGKFVESNGKILMPLSITVNHATTEGYHLKVFFEDLQNDMNDPDHWM